MARPSPWNIPPPGTALPGTSLPMENPSPWHGSPGTSWHLPSVPFHGREYSRVHHGPVAPFQRRQESGSRAGKFPGAAGSGTGRARIIPGGTTEALWELLLPREPLEFPGIRRQPQLSHPSNPPAPSFPRDRGIPAPHPAPETPPRETSREFRESPPSPPALREPREGRECSRCSSAPGTFPTRGSRIPGPATRRPSGSAGKRE